MLTIFLGISIPLSGLGLHKTSPILHQNSVFDPKWDCTCPHHQDLFQTLVYFFPMNPLRLGCQYGELGIARHMLDEMPVCYILELFNFWA